MFLRFNGRRTWCELNEADKGTGTGDLPADVVKSFERLLERHGNSATTVAQLLFTENKELRDKARQLEGRLPAEGAFVLSATDKATWDAYTALGKPDDIKQGLEQRTQLQGQLSGAQRAETLRTVAETVGYKAGVLSNLDRMAKAEGKELAFAVKDEQRDGKPVKVAYVTDSGKETALTEYAQSNWTDFLLALSVQGTQQQPATGQPARQAGTRYPAQHAGSGGAEKVTNQSVAQKTLDRAYRREDKK